MLQNTGWQRVGHDLVIEQQQLQQTRRINKPIAMCGGEGNGTPLQYSCLENPMDGGAWQAAVHEIAQSCTHLSDFIFTFHFHALEKEMATHSSTLAWRIPGTGEPGGLCGRTESDMTEATQHSIAQQCVDFDSDSSKSTVNCFESIKEVCTQNGH